ncbi:MAG: hypothetical protein FWH42_04515 [Dehalococcoidia bacterium]|nr:hypothetical protein [Dehalococcoidia bacterium]
MPQEEDVHPLQELPPTGAVKPVSYFDRQEKRVIVREQGFSQEGQSALSAD